MRQLANWVDAFADHVANLPSPEIFRKWGGISAVAGALERKVWVKTIGIDLFPNIYTVLVGPPGVGKTVVTSKVEELWRALPEHHVAPKSVTTASVIDSLADAKRVKTIIGTPSIHMEFNSLLINAGELGVLIPAYDSGFMNILTDIYDCRQYEERRRGKDLHIKIPKPQLNILAACTPSYLNGMLPEGAWDQGFLSRTFLVYSGDRIITDIFANDGLNAEEFGVLRADLKDIANLTGKMEFEPAAAAAISAWHMGGGLPQPEHPKLTHYLTRRTMHLLKLCMVACASQSSQLLITLAHYQEALGWLLEIETHMADIFKALGSRGDGQTIEEAYHFLYQLYMARSQPIPEHRLIGFLSERVPSHNVLRIVEIMERTGQIKKSLADNGRIAYTPQGKLA